MHVNNLLLDSQKVSTHALVAETLEQLYIVNQSSALCVEIMCHYCATSETYKKYSYVLQVIQKCRDTNDQDMMISCYTELFKMVTGYNMEDIIANSCKQESVPSSWEKKWHLFRHNKNEQNAKVTILTRWKRIRKISNYEPNSLSMHWLQIKDVTRFITLTKFATDMKISLAQVCMWMIQFACMIRW